MKIPFDIKYRPQIESGEYKVETRDGRSVKIISFELTDTNNCPIAAQFRLCAGTPIIYLFDEEGHYKAEGNSDYDLFIVTPEEELTEFEEGVKSIMIRATHYEDDYVQQEAKELLILAREQFIKDGYVIEKKVFHDAVEKVDSGVIKVVSANIDFANIDFENLIHDLSERYPEVSFAKLSRIAKVAYQKGGAETLKEFVEKFKQSWFNEGKIVGRFEGLSEDEKYRQGVHDGKEDALKDLPRWEKITKDGNAIVRIPYVGTNMLGEKMLYIGKNAISINCLMKLPDFKED